MMWKLHRWKHGLRPLQSACRAPPCFTLSESFTYHVWVMLPHQTYFDVASGALLPNTEWPVLGTIWTWNKTVVPCSKKLTRKVREMAERCRPAGRCREMQWAQLSLPTGTRGCAGIMGQIHLGFSMSPEGEVVRGLPGRASACAG